MKENKCEYCGSKENVEFQQDPYQAEINNDFTDHWLCDECVELAGDEI